MEPLLHPNVKNVSSTPLETVSWKHGRNLDFRSPSKTGATPILNQRLGRDMNSHVAAKKAEKEQLL